MAQQQITVRTIETLAHLLGLKLSADESADLLDRFRATVRDAGTLDALDLGSAEPAIAFRARAKAHRP